MNVTEQRERIDAGSLAQALLEYAVKPAGPELQQKCTKHHLDELRLLDLFSVDYVLGMKAVRMPAFTRVRLHYNQEIERFCASEDSPFSYCTVMARFEAYAEACNANTLASMERKGKRALFWELGEMISRLASDADPWVPNALEVAMRANLFVRDCQGLAQFLTRYELTD